MNFEIKVFLHTPKVCFYTVHKDGNELSENQLFINRFKDDPQFTEYLQVISRLITNMGRLGADRSRFRPEDNAYALPFKHVRSGLRLYCIVCSNETIILCGGGKKEGRTVQESLDAFPHFSFAKKVDTLLVERIKSGEIYYNGKFLEGDLIFEH